MPRIRWESALVAATAVHAGFQLSVTTLVYPALGEVAPDAWTAAHARHSRRIVPLVGLVYGAVVVTSAGCAFTRPSVPTLAAAAASAGALATTALVAAPLHGRLTPIRDPELFARLLSADRWRSRLALVALAAALGQVGRPSPVSSRWWRSSTSES